MKNTTFNSTPPSKPFDTIHQMHAQGLYVKPVDFQDTLPINAFEEASTFYHEISKDAYLLITPNMVIHQPTTLLNKTSKHNYSQLQKSNCHTIHRQQYHLRQPFKNSNTFYRLTSKPIIHNTMKVLNSSIKIKTMRLIQQQHSPPMIQRQ